MKFLLQLGSSALEQKTWNFIGVGYVFICEENLENAQFIKQFT